MRPGHAFAAAAAAAGLAACVAGSGTSHDASGVDAPATDAAVDAPPPGPYQFIYVKQRSEVPFDFVKEVVLGSLDGRYFNLTPMPARVGLLGVSIVETFASWLPAPIVR